ncbi:hypothetical protein Taro_032792 [Colocasia esculenta]|uniref:XPG N-terminal domain-containing protein n=1 Tax=Colocasia esculenta TaxID=4460 RepID=A0A843VM75_COLES|nr:hypothetical protein [Colocasia esculenta]
MGVKNLWDILECCKKTLPLQHLQNKRVCVDLSCWMVQFQTACRSAACFKEKLYLQSLFHRLRALIALNCSLILVTDGSIPAIKLTAYRRRLGTNSEKYGFWIFMCDKGGQSFGSGSWNPLLRWCNCNDHHHLQDGCFTADSDVFLFGARTVYRDIFLGDNGHVVCYDMTDVEEKLGFGRNSLITLALLLGSDYSQGVRGFGPETACQFVKSIGNDTILEKIRSGQLAISRKVQKNKKKGETPAGDRYGGQDMDNVQDLGDKSLKLLQIVCVHLPFRHSLLQQMCDKFFHWDSDKTDQYILPKIAERDLRNFANFRTISEELGVRISLQEMPVACPAFTIMKQRKLQGRECFEISWQDFGRLVASTVPADLVISACPEKVAEFMERKAEGKKKKRKPKQKKPEKAAIANVDLQLQSLMLSIDLEDELHSDLTRPSTSSRPKEETRVVDLTTPSPPLRACKMAKCLAINDVCKNAIDLASETDILLPEMTDTGFIACNAAEREDVRQCTYRGTILLPQNERKSVECSEKDAFEFEKISSCCFDVIDLSPLQPNGQKWDRKTRVSVVPNKVNSEEDFGHQVDVIDVCDSESDASPEHQRKARELRLFIDSIKGDLY